MVNMVPQEAFACSCEEGDVVLRQSYKPESCASEIFWMWIFLWKETRIHQLMSSPGAPSAGPSTPPNYSSGPSTPLSYSSRLSTPPNYSSRSLRNVECSNCKHLRPSTPPNYSSGPSTPPSYSSGLSTPPNYSSQSSRNAECSNCKHLRGKISVLKATMNMHMHPEQHIVNSAALLHEVLNEMEKFDFE
uniref:Uncharacterized protein n=1 Tax=Tanacetum cinerariifolium TaxID=118510 RepID=A0A699JGA7_TANCI|nr:hypothetical protein [Tanacetum cinerariifolium]